MIIDGLTTKCLAQNIYPRQTDREKGLYASDWIGTGVSVTEPCLELGTSAAVSIAHLVETPYLILSARSSDWSATYWYVATATNGNGYKLTFATVSSVTQIKLERWDSGSGTSLGTYDCATTWGTSDKPRLELLIMSGAIVVKLDGQAIIQTADTTHRLTDWHNIVGGATVSCYEFHYLKLHTEKAVYQYTFLEVNLWTSQATLQAGYVTLASGWDAMWTYRMFPRDKFIIKVDLTISSATESKWGIVTPDKSQGIYIEWKTISTKKWRVMQADGTVIGDSITSAGTQDWALAINRDLDDKILGYSLTTPSTITASSCSAYYREGCYLHTVDITTGYACTIHSISLSNDNTTYGYTMFTAREVGFAAQSTVDLMAGAIDDISGGIL